MFVVSVLASNMVVVQSFWSLFLFQQPFSLAPWLSISLCFFLHLFWKRAYGSYWHVFVGHPVDSRQY